MRVFISRHLETKRSPFYQKLQQFGIQAKGQSMIEFSPVTFKTVPYSHWIFFYSKTAIAYFFEHLPPHFNKNIIKWATIGAASAVYLRQYGIQADFVGCGEPIATAKAFLDVAENKKVLFPRALHSKKSIQELLDGDIKVIDFIVYNNRKRQQISKQLEEILVFTSPMNVQAYFAQHSILPYQQLIAIGNTTAKALRSLGHHQFAISAQPSEQDLAESVLNLVARKKASR